MISSSGLSRRRLLGLAALHSAAAFGLHSVGTARAATNEADFVPALVVGTGYGAADTTSAKAALAEFGAALGVIRRDLSREDYLQGHIAAEPVGRVS